MHFVDSPRLVLQDDVSSIVVLREYWTGNGVTWLADFSYWPSEYCYWGKKVLFYENKPSSKATCDQHDSAGNLLGNMTQHLSSWHRDSALLVTVVVLVDLILRIRKCWREFYEGLHKIWKYWGINVIVICLLKGLQNI